MRAAPPPALASSWLVGADGVIDGGNRGRDDELLEKMRRGDTSKLHYFINKPPRWNDQVGAGGGGCGWTYRGYEEGRGVMCAHGGAWWWRGQVGAYVLNFNGRVTMASVKNFQLIDPDDQEAIILQVRKDKDTHTPSDVTGQEEEEAGPPPDVACVLHSLCGLLSVRPRGQGRVHDGLPVAHLALPGLRHHALLLRLQDRLRLRQQPASRQSVRHSC